MPTSDWKPAVQAVGSLLRSRTKDTNGNELGTFTPATRPTNTQVEDLIVQATGAVESAIGGSELLAALWPAATAVSVLGTALLIELTYYPEQVTSGRSPYTQLKELYDERLLQLRLQIEAGGVDTPGDGTVGPNDPAWSFPMGEDPFSPTPLVGWETAW